MTKMVVIQRPSMFRDFTVLTIKENFPEISIVTFDGLDNDVLFDKENIGDIVLLDMDTQDSFLYVIQHYKKLKKKIIVWIPNEKDPRLVELLLKGLDGYFFEKMNTNEFIDGITMILSGKVYIHPYFSSVAINIYLNKKFAQRSTANLFTKKERQVLILLTQGKSNKEIAAFMSISESTVSNHVHSILTKIKVKDRTNAVLWALKQKWILSKM